MIKRAHSNLYLVKNLDETVKFYKKLDFDVGSSDEEAVRIKLGDFTVAFLDENKATIKSAVTDGEKGKGIFTYLEVEDVDKYYEFVKSNGIEPNTEPKNWPWGKREFVVKDPDGYRLVFYSPIDK